MPVAALNFDVGIVYLEVHAAADKINLTLIGDAVVVQPSRNVVFNLTRLAFAHSHHAFGVFALLLRLAFVPRVPVMVALIVTELTVRPISTTTGLQPRFTAVSARYRNRVAFRFCSFARLRQMLTGARTKYSFATWWSSKYLAALLANSIRFLGGLPGIIRPQNATALIGADARLASLIVSHEGVAADVTGSHVGIRHGGFTPLQCNIFNYNIKHG